MGRLCINLKILRSQPQQLILLKPEITTNGNARSSIRPGDIKYRDINGDGVVNDFDRTVIGRGILFIRAVCQTNV